ncbi:MAG: DUF4340 domain-containing protein [Clostridia bacterium]|nr:DUF4340 domain-containing protein [Clostridia bacterium]
MKENQENSTIFVKRTYDKPPRKAKKTGLRILIYLLAACLLAAGIYFVSTLLPDKKDHTPSGSLPTTQVLYLKAEDVQSISVKNTASFTLSYTAENGNDSQYIWKLEGVDPEVTDASLLQSYAEALLSIEALRTMTGTEGDYGFLNDGSGITITLTDGTKHTLQFGAESMDGIGNYMLVDNHTVYVVDSSLAEQAAATPSEFANLTVLKALSTEDYAEYVTDSTITGFDRFEITKKGSDTVVITAKRADDAFVYGIESPKSATVAAKDMQPLLSLLQSGLTADGLYSYGICDPENTGRTITYEQFKATAAYTFYIKLGDCEIELAVSSADDDGNRALVCKGKNATYQISETTIQEWVTLL